MRALAGRARRRLRGSAELSTSDEVAARLDRQHRRISATERDLARIGPQVAALEARVEDLRQRMEMPVPGGDDAAHAEARSIVEEVRREHAQVRARISAAARYEERLRQLEEKLDGLS